MIRTLITTAIASLTVQVPMQAQAPEGERLEIVAVSTSIPKGQQKAYFEDLSRLLFDITEPGDSVVVIDATDATELGTYTASKKERKRPSEAGQERMGKYFSICEMRCRLHA